MRRVDFIVTIGADQKEVLLARLRNQMFKQIESCSVQPLKVIEKQYEGTARPSKHADEPTEYLVEPVPRFLWCEVGHRRLGPNDELNLWDQPDHKLSMRAESFFKGIPPAVDLYIGLIEDLSDKPLKGLSEDSVRDIALVLVELSGGEKTAWRHQRFVQF